MAVILTQATGNAIGFTDITPDAMLQGWLGAGLPRGCAEFLVLILGCFKAGPAERVTDAVQLVTGHVPHNFEQYAMGYRARWAWSVWLAV